MSFGFYRPSAKGLRNGIKSHGLTSTSHMSTLYKVAKNLDVVPRFYLLCFAFMIAMEGYYDELSGTSANESKNDKASPQKPIRKIETPSSKWLALFREFRTVPFGN